MQRENTNTIKKSMEDLNDRDRQIVIMRYGLDDNEPKTLGEVADLLDLSRERVRQIEERAVATLRREAIKAGILEYRTQDFRTRKLHSAMKKPAKTNLLGELEMDKAWAKLLKKAGRTLTPKPAPKKCSSKNKSVSKKSAKKKAPKVAAKKSNPKKAAKKVSRRK